MKKKKFGRLSILDVLQRAMFVFVADPDTIDCVKFFYRDHIVIAFISPLPNDYGWIVSRFQVIHKRRVMDYFLGTDYDPWDAIFEC